MNQYTFRTEASCDNKAARGLVQAINGRLLVSQLIKDPSLPAWTMGQYTFESQQSLESLRAGMFKIIRINPRYADLHRCAQTLAEGYEPNNSWYMD